MSFMERKLQAKFRGIGTAQKRVMNQRRGSSGTQDYGNFCLFRKAEMGEVKLLQLHENDSWLLCTNQPVNSYSGGWRSVRRVMCSAAGQRALRQAHAQRFCKRKGAAGWVRDPIVHSKNLPRSSNKINSPVLQGRSSSKINSPALQGSHARRIK